MVNYWIFKVASDENEKYSRKGIEIYKHRMPECFWGLKKLTKTERKTPNVARLKARDFVLFYLVGKEGHCFLGTCVLNSGFRPLTPKESKNITHPEYLDWEQGAFLKKDTVDIWAKPLPIERLRGKVHFVPNDKNYGSYLQGSVTKIHDKRDYNTVVREHELNESGKLSHDS